MAATNEFMHHLSMAACEWFLMFLMFIDAALNFILTKFAHHCELQSPCLYCFRFDRVFGYEKPDYYLTHFCNKHQAEVSCLVSCGLHHKLADVRQMCDDCFMSIMKHKHGYPKPYLNKNLARAPSSTGSCSCCKRQWKPKPKSQIKLRVPKATMQPPLPLITSRSGRFRRRDYIRKAREKISLNTRPGHMDSKIQVLNADVDALSDSGCADLRFSSCSGSESDDSFYEIECENDGFVNDSCVVIRKPDRTKSVSDLEPLLSNGLNGPHNVNGVKENGPVEVSNETGSLNHEEFESPSAHSVGEVEKLKRQVECDQEQLRLLHTELEEERNAASIAADEAMAMITRLQEEKAALHMEALQYLRMMDEQAEYDMEALDKANDLVTEKDKEIQDLEAELEFFRNRYNDDDVFEGIENHTGNGNTDFVGSSDLEFTNHHPVLELEDEEKYID